MEGGRSGSFLLTGGSRCFPNSGKTWEHTHPIPKKHQDLAHSRGLGGLVPSPPGVFLHKGKDLALGPYSHSLGIWDWIAHSQPELKGLGCHVQGVGVRQHFWA